MVMLATKTPPQPLPTRGRGLPAATARQDANLSTGTKMKCGNSTAPQLSPSPLWGGVGEGTSAAPAELASPPHPPAGTFSPSGRRDSWRATRADLPFSPTGVRRTGRDQRLDPGRWPEGSDEGATGAEASYSRAAKAPCHRRARITPLCPAGHLPHKGGDWLGAPARSTFVGWRKHRNESISPLVGEMPGRAEGGTPPTNLSITLPTPKRAHP
jgi:hypothetical protein